MDGLVALTGTLIDVRAHAFVDQGTDFVDPTSVEATVTRGGRHAPIETTKLAPRRDGPLHRPGQRRRPTHRELHADRDGDQLERGAWAASRSLSRSTPGRSSSSNRRSRARLQGAADVEVVADAGPFPPRRPPRHGRQLRRRARRRRRSGEQPYRGMIDLQTTPEIRRCSSMQLLTVWATNGNGKRVVQHGLLHRRRGTDDHDDAPRRRARSSATSCASRPRSLDPSGVLDASVIAVIGDDTGTRCSTSSSSPRRRRLQRPVRHAQADRVRGSARADRPLHRLPDDLVPRLRRARQRARRRLRLHRRQHRAGRRPRSAQAAVIRIRTP